MILNNLLRCTVIVSSQDLRMKLTYSTVTVFVYVIFDIICKGEDTVLQIKTSSIYPAIKQKSSLTVASK